MRYSSYAWSFVTVLVLSAVNAGSSSFAANPPETAIGLLTAYSGDSAKQHENAFRYSDNARIVRVEIHAVGMENTTARYSGREAAWLEVNNILRITTADGFEGVSGVDSYYQGQFSDEHMRELQDVAADLIALKSLDPVKVGSLLRQTRPDIGDEVRSSIDIALWDLAARRANVSLYELLGAKRQAIKPYASLPFYETLPEYVDAVYEYAKLGYTAFKFHVWGSIEEDLLLIELIQQTFADSAFRFMVDVESMYGFEDALRLGELMDETLWVIYEAPIDDGSLTEYAELSARLDVQVIPGGYTYHSPDFIRQAIAARSWDSGRFDVTVIGGISNALELLMIADEAGMPIEIQSWGHSLAQVANLHLMLANERTQYFEAPMPKDVFEFGMLNGNLLIDGNTVAPAEPGLGINVDWNSLSKADFYAYAIVDPADPAK